MVVNRGIAGAMAPVTKSVKVLYAAEDELRAGLPTSTYAGEVPEAVCTEV